MSWELEIEKVENGFVITTYDDMEDKIRLPRKVIFEFKEPTEYGEGEERKSEVETMRDVLYHIAEYFNLGYDRWAKNNIEIKTDRAGHEVEDGNE